MRLTTRQTGIISYAGLDTDALWAGAKRAFAQSDDEIPERFRSFLPLFPSELIENMSYVGIGARLASPQGFSRDGFEYHRQLCDEMPDLYVGDNYSRAFDKEGRFKGGVITVDDAWTTRFPQYQPFLGERLVIHMIGGGHQAVAVPQSVFPAGGGVLDSCERELGITSRCEHFCQYMRRRIGMGEKYDPTLFEEEYLKQNDLARVVIRQRELSRVMQDLCILRGLETDEESAEALFTENARRAENVLQYVPWRYACDTFESVPVTRSTARLVQLYYQGDSFISDLWLPYQDACEYISTSSMMLDVGALCQGFQIAPAYDAKTRGGRYPDRIRVAIVRDRELEPMVADTVNNPAYGSGIGPLGIVNKLVFLPESKTLLQNRRLVEETCEIETENALVSADTYRMMCEQAALQEWKGRLVDALYRRESALAQMHPGSDDYEHVSDRLSARVDELMRRVQSACPGLPEEQVSGYDLDIDYLLRMKAAREGLVDEQGHIPLFTPDPLREMCIESGYAMRGSVKRYPLEHLRMQVPDASYLMMEAQQESIREEKAKLRKPAAVKVKRQEETHHLHYVQMDMFDAGAQKPAEVIEKAEPCRTEAQEASALREQEKPRETSSESTIQNQPSEASQQAEHYVSRSLADLTDDENTKSVKSKMAQLFDDTKF